MPDLIINNFNKGIADTPHLGFQDIRQVDVSVTGVARTGMLCVTSNSTITGNGVPKWILKNPGGNYYALTDDGKVFKSGSASSSWTQVTGNTTTSASGNGMAIYKDHLFVARNAKLDCMKISDETWYNDWQSLNTDSAWHPMLVGQDDILYIGNSSTTAGVAPSVASVQSFVAGAPPTATFTAAALTLPYGYRIKCLAELGVNLMVGTIKGTNLWGGDYGADIFPWNRSATTFTLPIQLKTFGVHQMISVQNVLYAVAGFRGEIYATNGVSVKLLRKLPYFSVINLAGDNDTSNFLNFFPGAIIYAQNRIYFAVSSGTTGANIAGALGVWSIGEDGTLLYENKVATTTITADNNLLIGALCYAVEKQFAVGYKDDTTARIDYVGTSRVINYDSYIISPLIAVGTTLHRKAFSQIEASFAKPLATSHGVRLSYRKNLSDAFTAIGTLDFATYGAVMSVNVPALIADAEYVQIKIELVGGNNTSPQLKEIILR